MVQKRLIWSILLLFSLFILAGCETPVDVKETKNLDSNKALDRFNDLISKADSVEEYMLGYKMNMLNSYFMGSGTDMYLGVMKKGELEKYIVETMGVSNSNSIVLKTKDAKFSCSESYDYIGTSTRDSYSCARVDDGKYPDRTYEVLNTSQKILSEEFEVEYNGSYNVIGRSCEMFIFDIDNATTLNLTYTTGYGLGYGATDSNISVVLCIDEKNGLPLIIKYLTRDHSEVLGEDVTLLMKGFKAVRFEGAVADDEFDLPVAFGLSAIKSTGSEISVMIVPLKDFEGALKIELQEPNYFSRGGKPNEKKIITFPNKKFSKFVPEVLSTGYTQTSGYGINAKVCIGKDCVDSFLSTTDYADYQCFKRSYDETECMDEDGCMFSEGICQEFNCDSLDEEEDCVSYNQCLWRGSDYYAYCSDKSCYDMETEKDCMSLDNCRWDGYCYTYYNRQPFDYEEDLPPAMGGNYTY